MNKYVLCPFILDIYDLIMFQLSYDVLNFVHSEFTLGTIYQIVLLLALCSVYCVTQFIFYILFDSLTNQQQQKFKLDDTETFLSYSHLCPFFIIGSFTLKEKKRERDSTVDVIIHYSYCIILFFGLY